MNGSVVELDLKGRLKALCIEDNMSLIYHRLYVLAKNQNVV